MVLKKQKLFINSSDYFTSHLIAQLLANNISIIFLPTNHSQLFNLQVVIILSEFPLDWNINYICNYPSYT